MSVLRKLFAALAALSYTLLYGIPYGGLAFDFLANLDRHGAGGVLSSDLTAVQISTTIMLHIGLMIIVVAMKEKIRGLLIYSYMASLIASFFMPLIFTDMRSRGFFSFSWQFYGVVWTVFNILLGPAMVMLLSYFAVRLIKKA